MDYISVTKDNLEEEHISQVNRAMTLKESSKIGFFFCVILATDTILFLTKRFQKARSCAKLAKRKKRTR